MKLFFLNNSVRTIFASAIVFGLVPGAQAHHDSDTLELYPRDAADACIPGALQIRIHVKGVTHVGLVKLDIYNDPDTFLKKKGKLKKVRVPAEDGEQTICMNVPEPGTYGIAGYHDKDGDRKLDKKINFKPKEPFGLSNNPKIKSLRRPKFEEVAFEVGPAGADIDLILVDPKAKKKQKRADRD